VRNAEVIRQWKILKTIEAGRYTTAGALADEHGVTERTIRRDLEALQEAGFPLYDERAEGGRKVWRLIEGYKQRLTQTFTLSELAALYFGKNLMSFLGGAPFANDLESAFAKIREALPARSLPYLARIQDLFSARPEPWKDYSKKKDVIAALIDATLHQRRAVIEYYSFRSRRTKRYTVDAYRVVYYHGGLYLYARVDEYAEVRTFAVERISRIEVTDEEFEIPADFSISEFARGAFGIEGGKPEPVAIAFDAKMEGYVRERVWHESQSLEQRPDGSVVLRMTVARSPELKSWIKSFAPHARVLEPAALRDEILADLRAALS
jgi:predicted DNA-binding transcriptional regulator YafY